MPENQNPPLGSEYFSDMLEIDQMMNTDPYQMVSSYLFSARQFCNAIDHILEQSANYKELQENLKSLVRSRDDFGEEVKEKYPEIYVS